MPELKTVRQQIAWAYANLACAHAALADDVREYSPVHYSIRSRCYRDLTSGEMSMRSLYDDERLKMTMPQACYYCGSGKNLVVDHLIPRIRGGPDDSDNLIWACRTCNSSKHGRDMLAWTAKKGISPSVLLLRRYLKIVARYCEKHGYMDIDLSRLSEMSMPFDVLLLPTRPLPLKGLELWVYPNEEKVSQIR